MRKNKHLLIAFFPLIFFIIARLTKLTTRYDWPFYASILIAVIVAIIVPKWLKIIPLITGIALVFGLVVLGGYS